MTKRLISAILVLALTLSAVILPVNADEKVLTATKINLMYDGSVDEVSVYRYGDDIYFSGEDLFAYTYYDYENDGKKAVFTRGAKEVIINLSDDEFTVKAAGLDTDWKWNNPPVKIDGEWYFSGADLLPWLNVKCGNDGGCLAIIPDEWSYWDVCEQLDVFSYNISYSSVCMELSWDSKVVKALKCTDDNLGEMILEGVNIEDEYGGNASDYYDILEGFLLEKSSTAKVADQIHKYVNYGLDVLGILIDGYDEIFTAFELYSDGALYASNYVAFTHDNNNKMEVIDMIFTTTGGEGKEGTQQLNDGANLIKVAYSSWWNNIITNYILNLDEKLIDKIKDGITAGNPLINALLMAVDVATEESRSLNKRIKLMPCYLNIYSLGVDLLDGNQSSHIVLLESSLDTLNISLYAAAENARTLSEYCEDKELYSVG